MNVERARDLLGTDLAALVGESYERAYADMLRVQQLTELEEILAVKRAQEEEAAVFVGGGSGSGGGGGGHGSYVPLSGASGKELMQTMWNGRLRGVQRNVEVWQALLRWAAVWGVIIVGTQLFSWLSSANLPHPFRCSPCLPPPAPYRCLPLPAACAA